MSKSILIQSMIQITLPGWTRVGIFWNSTESITSVLHLVHQTEWADEALSMVPCLHFRHWCIACAFAIGMSYPWRLGKLLLASPVGSPLFGTYVCQQGIHTKVFTRWVNCCTREVIPGLISKNALHILKKVKLLQKMHSSFLADQGPKMQSRKICHVFFSSTFAHLQPIYSIPWNMSNIFNIFFGCIFWKMQSDWLSVTFECIFLEKVCGTCSRRVYASKNAFLAHDWCLCHTATGPLSLINWWDDNGAETKARRQASSGWPWQRNGKYWCSHPAHENVN